MSKIFKIQTQWGKEWYQTVTAQADDAGCVVVQALTDKGEPVQGRMHITAGEFWGLLHGKELDITLESTPTCHTAMVLDKPTAGKVTLLPIDKDYNEHYSDRQTFGHAEMVRLFLGGV